LNGAILHKGILERIELALLREAFNRYNPLALSPDGQGKAGKNRFTIHDDGASAALSLSAALFRSRKPQLVSQNIGQGPVRPYEEIVLKTIHLQPNLFFHPLLPRIKSDIAVCSISEFYTGRPTAASDSDGMPDSDGFARVTGFAARNPATRAVTINLFRGTGSTRLVSIRT
jgi:hypothetical protein